MQYRDYDPKRDGDAAHRIWREVGWLEKGKEEAADELLACGRALVAEVNGEAECLVNSASGTMRYLEEELAFAACTGVATGRVARKQGLAKRMLARLIAADAADGTLVAGLGMFDQGFYNQVGYGTGGYEHSLSFDPSTLRVDRRARPPRRLGGEDAELIHGSRLARLRGHGGLNLHPAATTRSELRWSEKGFGLGYCEEGSGELTHHVWIGTDNIESGPYRVSWTAYRDYDQFLELLAVIKTLGDQVRLVSMREPQGIQLQDLLDRPFKHRQVTAKSRFENRAEAEAYWQMRMCDLPRCLAQTHLRGDEVRFNLKLSDPIAELLEEDSSWRGVGGEYVVTLGPSSGAEVGRDRSLLTLSASVNAFTRLWLGVRPATGLAVTDGLSGPAELLEELDWVLRLPEPKPDWDY